VRLHPPQPLHRAPFLCCVRLLTHVLAAKVAPAFNNSNTKYPQPRACKKGKPLRKKEFSTIAIRSILSHVIARKVALAFNNSNTKYPQQRACQKGSSCGRKSSQQWQYEVSSAM
jgi:hypothetical protein